MIIGRDFIWLHFPKCAGVHTEKILHTYFQNDPDIRFDKIDPSNVIWHQNVPEREKSAGISLQGKAVICNFRRLPSWMLSRIKFEEKRSGIVTTKEEYVRGKFHEAGGFLNHADVYVKKYTVTPVNHWIRTEYLRDDFVQAFSPYLDLSAIDLDKEFSTKSNATEYERELTQWFSQEDLNTLYASCPLWASLELSLYGNRVSFRRRDRIHEALKNIGRTVRGRAVIK